MTICPEKWCKAIIKAPFYTMSPWYLQIRFLYLFGVKHTGYKY